MCLMSIQHLINLATNVAVDCLFLYSGKETMVESPPKTDPPLAENPALRRHLQSVDIPMTHRRR